MPPLRALDKSLPVPEARLAESGLSSTDRQTSHLLMLLRMSLWALVVLEALRRVLILAVLAVRRVLSRRLRTEVEVASVPVRETGNLFLLLTRLVGQSAPPISGSLALRVLPQTSETPETSFFSVGKAQAAFSETAQSVREQTQVSLERAAGSVPAERGRRTASVKRPHAQAAQEAQVSSSSTVSSRRLTYE